jgi:hypothetical protein
MNYQNPEAKMVIGSTWLLGTTQYRANLGALAADGFGFTNQLTTDNDALVFIGQTTPTVQN